MCVPCIACFGIQLFPDQLRVILCSTYLCFSLSKLSFVRFYKISLTCSDLFLNICHVSLYNMSLVIISVPHRLTLYPLLLSEALVLRRILAFSKIDYHLFRSLMRSFQFIFILVMSLFILYSHLFLCLPSHLVNAGENTFTFLPCCYLTYDTRDQTKRIFVL